MSNDPTLAVAILAGGRARRFGGIDKSALPLAGRSILDRLLDAVRPVSPHVFAVGDTMGAAGRAGLEVVPDLIPDAGALGGIYTAIVRSPCDRTLVLGCDMPFVTTALLERLAGVSGVDVVMPRTAAGYQPLCAVYGRGCAAAIRERLDRGERHAAVPPGGVRLAEIGPQELAAYDPDGLLFVNVNTPHDYAQAQRILDRAGRPDATTDD
jgi:molybdopterin-guanine dinucleotide biosynthesis protein A